MTRTADATRPGMVSRLADMNRPASEQLLDPNRLELAALPEPPGAEATAAAPFAAPKDSWKDKYCAFLDGFVGLDALQRPATEAEERRFLEGFVTGLRHALDPVSNRGSLQQLVTSLDFCAKCNTCSEACHVFAGAGRAEIYRPLFRSEVLRRIVRDYVRGRLTLDTPGSWLRWETVARLGELAYRCNLCRRCAQACPLGLDNAVLAREVRKALSQELGLAPTALHASGTQLQLRTGSSTGLTKPALLDTLAFIEDFIGEKTGRTIKIPLDKKGADILLIHNAGEFLAWPENPAAFAILFEAAGLDWTLCSDMLGYDSVNYGVWYDDTQAREIGARQLQAAHDLGARRIVLGECGHAHRASMVSLDRAFGAAGRGWVPRESCLPLLAEMVEKKVLRFDPARNDFPVTLHDPCNLVRAMGIVKPQRVVLRAICPGFREMAPSGVTNYCCGGGSGFAVMQSLNFPDFRNRVSSRMKYRQILEAFQPELGGAARGGAAGMAGAAPGGGVTPNPSRPKYVCAPCSNCKGTIRDMFDYHKATSRLGLRYGGLAELMVNALADLKAPYLDFLSEVGA